MSTWDGFQSGLALKWSRTSPWRKNVQRRRTMLLDDLARLQLEKAPALEERLI